MQKYMPEIFPAAEQKCSRKDGCQKTSVVRGAVRGAERGVHLRQNQNAASPNLPQLWSRLKKKKTIRDSAAFHNYLL